MRLAGHVARVYKKIHIMILVEIREGKKPLGDQGIVKEIILGLKCI
jgi:hypothetical protein